MKSEEKIKAVKLRRKGKSYGEILKRLKVSKGTLSLWLRDVKLTSGQYRRLYVTLRRRNAYRAAKVRQKQRIEKTRRIVSEAEKEVSRLIKSHLFLSGLMLYWAEGDKSDEREVVKFTNSDPILIKLMMAWFRRICKVKNEKFRIELHIHAFHCRRNIKEYWSKLVCLPLSQFHKVQIKQTSLRRRKNKLYNGTCAIRISDRDLFRRIKGWKVGFIKNSPL